MITDKRVQAIYEYLIECVSEDEIKALITYLQDYSYNGSYVDFEAEDRTLEPLINDLCNLLGFERED